MPLTNLFENDLFSMAELTASINKMPFVPSRLGSMNLFTPKPQRTTVAVVEEQHGKLVLISTKARGGPADVYGSGKREGRPFNIPHLPLNGAVLADDVQGIRDMGSEDQLKEFSTEVNDKLQAMRTSHELTHEWHRLGAISGDVLDADLTSSVYNWFDEFGLTETVKQFELDDAATGYPIKEQCREVRFAIEDALGATPYTGIHALCSRQFFTDLITSAEVAEAYERWENNSHARGDQTAFEYGGISWEEYRGSIGGTQFIAEDTCRFFPTGAPELFVAAIAPANFMETVNRRGKLIYAKQERMEFDMGMKLHTQSNVLHMCTRPACLVKGRNTDYSSESSGS